MKFSALDNFCDKPLKTINESDVGTKNYTQGRFSCCFQFDYPVLLFLVSFLFLSDLINVETKMPNIPDAISKYNFKNAQSSLYECTVIAQYSNYSLVFISLHRSFNDLRRSL